MKKLVIAGILLSFLSSCNMDNITSKEVLQEQQKQQEQQDADTLTVHEDNSFPPPIIPDVVIVDSEFNDRLNPESPAYFGDEYVKGIELFYLHEGKRITPYEAYRFSGGGKYWFVDDLSVFDSPVNPEKRPYYDKDGILHMIRENPLDCYFIPLGTVNISTSDDHYNYINYICYPDGSEDEIKIQLYKVSKGVKVDKIWVNDELAYAVSENEKLSLMGKLPDSVDITNPDDFLSYYNPKYIPLDDIGNQVKPKYDLNILVLMK